MENIYVDIRLQNRWIREVFDNKDMISIDEMFEAIEDLLEEKDEIRLEYEEFKCDVADNYVRAPLAEQLDISDRDFI